MFEQEKPRYCTKGISENVPMELQLFLWAALEQERQSHDMDYLQVFRLKLDEEGTLWIDYIQEQPERKQTYALTDVGNEIPEELNGRKIFVMDDETHITMLFAEEY